MKEVIGKARKTQQLLPCKVIVHNIEINKEKQIVNEFSNFLTNIGSGLTKEILRSAKSFQSYVPKPNTIMSFGPIGFNELKNASF